MLSYRRETALQGGLVMAQNGRLEQGDNIYGYYRSIFNYCDVLVGKEIKFSEKTQTEGYYAVQGHSRSSRSISVEARVRLRISIY